MNSGTHFFQSSKARQLAVALAATIPLLSARISLADDPIAVGAASLGTVGGALGLWPTDGSQSVWNKYTIIGGANNNTYINARTGGSIFFRLNNTGVLPDPDGGRALAFLDPNGVLHTRALTSDGWLTLSGSPGVQITSLAKVDTLAAVRGIGVAITASTPDPPKDAIAASNFTSASDGTAVKGTTDVGYGVYGGSNANIGVYGYSAQGRGVYGQGNVGVGVTGVSDTAAGVQGQSRLNSGVIGRSDQGRGVDGASNVGYAGYFVSGAIGVYASGHDYGVFSDGPLFVNSPNAYKIGGSGTFIIQSDRRLKRDVVPFTGGLAELRKVKPVAFAYNGLGGSDRSGRRYVGVIAQELELVAPEMVISTKKKLRDTDATETDIKQIDPSAFTYMLINAVNDLSRENDRLAEQNRRLGARNDELADAGAQLRRLVCAAHADDAFCQTKVAVQP